MPVEKAEKDIASLVGQVSSGEIRLPEIQRAFIWKPTQVARLIESLYRGYPSGTLLFWRTLQPPEIRAMAAEAPTAKPAVLPMYLLDGQQRLTSLHRVMNDHPEAQIVFNVEKEEFQTRVPPPVVTHAGSRCTTWFGRTSTSSRCWSVSTIRSSGSTVERLASAFSG